MSLYNNYSTKKFLYIYSQHDLLPFSAIQQSSRLLCLANSCGVMSKILPPVPAKSLPECPSFTQSIKLRPGLRAVLFLGLPANNRKT